jgi:hypothetical protein
VLTDFLRPFREPDETIESTGEATHIVNRSAVRAGVRGALRSLLTRDIDLLERNVAERAIAAKLAGYLAQRFRRHDVDVEYNRHGVDPKDVDLPRSCRDRKKALIVPDIIVHRRGTDAENLLVIEMKKRTNRESRACDRAKIIAMKRELSYEHGALIVLPAGRGAKEQDVNEEWF